MEESKRRRVLLLGLSHDIILVIAAENGQDKGIFLKHTEVIHVLVKNVWNISVRQNEEIGSYKIVGLVPIHGTKKKEVKVQEKTLADKSDFLGTLIAKKVSCIACSSNEGIPKRVRKVNWRASRVINVRRIITIRGGLPVMTSGRIEVVIVFQMGVLEKVWISCGKPLKATILGYWNKGDDKREKGVTAIDSKENTFLNEAIPTEADSTCYINIIGIWGVNVKI